MSDLVERAKSWDRCYPGNLNIERLVDDMTAEITRLRAALADAQAVGFAAGVEAAAKVAAMQAVLTRGTIERATGSELISNLVTVTKSKTAHDIETAIRALTPPDLTAAAARVLLADRNLEVDGGVVQWAASKSDKGGWADCVTSDGFVVAFHAALRAIAGDTR